MNVQMLSNKGGFGDIRLQTTRYVTCVIEISTRMQNCLYMDKRAFAGSCGQIHKMDKSPF